MLGRVTPAPSIVSGYLCTPHLQVTRSYVIGLVSVDQAKWLIHPHLIEE